MEHVVPDYPRTIPNRRSWRAMKPMRLVVAPHWRPQMRDIVRTLRAAARSDGAAANLKVLGVVPGLASIAARRTRGLSVLVSDDDESKLIDRLAGSGQRPGRVRIWWNTPAEITDYLNTGAGRGETHVCFFRDGWALLDPPPDTAVVAVPYAFTTPVANPKPAAPSGVWYAAEVDISDDCFTGLIDSASTASLSARVWELARTVVAGEAWLIEADALLRADVGERPQAHGMALWALRNRIRYLLVEGLVDAFPGRMHLRGDHWVKLGMPAEPTKFRRWRRLSEYAEYRVALDLGSKSTHSWLYPRVADILAAGGGLAQFGTGADDVAVPPGLEGRRAASLTGLVAAVDRLLTLPGAEATAENLALHQVYTALRLESGKRLIAAVVREDQ